jgi:glutamate dehydrogenase (NAD(P)+)
MHRNFGPNIDIPGPDVGTDPSIMAWFHDEYSVLYGYSLAAVTGKPVLIGGCEGRESATGEGVGIVMHEYAKHRAELLEDRTAVVQGFGKVGLHAALDLESRGMRVIAVSDSRGAIQVLWRRRLANPSDLAQPLTFQIAASSNGTSRSASK